MSAEGWSKASIGWILAPIGIFVLAIATALTIQLRRRRRLRSSGLWPPPGPTSEPRRSMYGRQGAPWLITPTRVHPSQTSNWIPAVGPPRSEREEGFNELGEAPPPYNPNVKKLENQQSTVIPLGAPPEYGSYGNEPSTSMSLVQPPSRTLLSPQRM